MDYRKEFRLMREVAIDLIEQRVLAPKDEKRKEAEAIVNTLYLAKKVKK